MNRTRSRQESRSRQNSRSRALSLASVFSFSRSRLSSTWSRFGRLPIVILISAHTPKDGHGARFHSPTIYNQLSRRPRRPLITSLFSRHCCCCWLAGAFCSDSAASVSMEWILLVGWPEIQWNGLILVLTTSQLFTDESISEGARQSCLTRGKNPHYYLGSHNLWSVIWVNFVELLRQWRASGRRMVGRNDGEGDDPCGIYLFNNSS